MKKMLVIMLAIAFMFALASVALAAEPNPPINIGPGTPTYGDDGSSLWTYQDAQDLTAKKQGSYRAFEGTVTHTYNPAESAQGYTTNPHGGYDTTGDKCKICHAVHRSTGAYYLLRADSQDDACDYCHDGGSAHSAKVVYFRGTKDTTNGHTIGAPSVIPDSSVSQALAPTTLTGVDGDGNPISETVEVRTYSSKQNKMFRFARHHGHGAAGSGRSGYMRIGPLALGCLRCHQPHNALNMVWNPPTYESLGTGTPPVKSGGYKLLRRSPSGSIWGTSTMVVTNPDGVTTSTVTLDWNAGMVNQTAYLEYDASLADGDGAASFVPANNIITVPETTMTAANTGNDGVFPNTIYTKFEGEGDDPHQSPQSISQYATSAWCADCHNLNIGYWQHLTQIELGFRSHSDRTHPAPYTGAHEGPSQCYACHRNDLPMKAAGATDTDCSNCHYGSGYLKAFKDAGGVTDFPHSGNPGEVKLLGNYSADLGSATGTRRLVTPGMVDKAGQTFTGITLNNTQAVCLRCHTGIGTNH